MLFEKNVSFYRIQSFGDIPRPQPKLHRFRSGSVCACISRMGGGGDNKSLFRQWYCNPAQGLRVSCQASAVREQDEGEFSVGYRGIALGWSSYKEHALTKRDRIAA